MNLGHEAEDRQIHGEDEAADEPADEDHHDRFEHGQQAGHRRRDLVVVETGQLAEHLIEGSGLLADLDHLGHDEGKAAADLEGVGQAAAFGHQAPGLQDAVLDDQVARRVGRDFEAFEHGHAARQKRAQGPGDAGNGHLGHDLA